VLAIDLVHEHVRWFDVAIEVTVRARPVPRVGIVAGYSPFRHVGDDAIVEAHVRQLTEHAPEAHVLLFGEAPAALNERFGTEAAPSIHTYLMEGLDPGAGNLALLRRWVPRTLSLLRAARRRRAQGESGTSRSAADRFLEDLERIDVLIAASAGGFTSRYRREVLWPHAVTALAAAALGRPVVFSGLTVGPFNGVSDRIVAGFALRRAAAVLPRDGSGSVRALRGLAVPRRLVEVTVDPAAALESASPGSTLAALGVREPYAVIAAHAGAGAEHATLRLAVEHLRARGIATVFVPMIIEGEHDDRVFGRELACDRVLDELPPDDVVKGMVGTACVAVGTRYHLVVFAAAQGVAALGLYGDAYGERKLVGLAEQAGAGVSALPLTTGREELTRTLDQLLQAGSGSVLPAPHPLPGVAVALPALKTP
jgi:polysaccharide pyruvyl transferase WcaK-like protein